MFTCAVEMTMYVDLTCINVNRKDVYLIEKICIKNMGVLHSLKK